MDEPKSAGSGTGESPAASAKPPRPRDAKGRFGPGQPAPGPNVKRHRGGSNKLPRSIKEEALAACIAIGEDGKGKDGLRGYLRANGKLRDAIVVESIPTRPKEDPASPWASEDAPLLGGNGICPDSGRAVVSRNRHGKILTTVDDVGCFYGTDGKPMVTVFVIPGIASGHQILPGGKIVDENESTRFHTWHKTRSAARPTETDVETYFAMKAGAILPGPLRVIAGGNDEPPTAA